MGKTEFEQYHEDEVLSVPTNRINTTPNSPTERLMRVFDRFLFADITDSEEMMRITALDNMSGGQLDDYGDDWDLLRLGKSDDVYRFLLKLRSINRTSQGTFNEVIRIVAAVFNVDPHSFQIANDYMLNSDGTASGKPFQVSVRNLPLDKIEHPEIVQEFIQELQNALVLGVSLSHVTFVTSILTSIGISAVMSEMNVVELSSDVDTLFMAHEVTNTSYLRSTQQVTRNYEVESEEVNHG